MTYRVTPHRQFELGRHRAQARYSNSARLQSQISSGSRVQKPSDDPDAIKTILRERSVVDRVDNQLVALSESRSFLSQANSQLLEAQELVVQARGVAVEGRQSLDPTEREALASQLDLILNRLDGIVNSQANGRYIFGGAGSPGAPFANVASGNTTYSGTEASSAISIGGNAGVQLQFSGKAVFQPTASGTLVVSGQTGVRNGTGTSSGSTPTTLTVAHTLTTYAAGSGVQAGSSSAAGDTVIGASGTHRLTIRDTSGTGASGFISLNGGEEIAFTSSDTNLRITGPQGEAVFIDTTTITAGFNGDVDLTATGTLSIDGGATAVPIDFSTNQTLVNVSLGVVQHFDTTAVTQSGTAAVEYEANPDVFAAIRALRDDLRNTRGLTNTELDEAINRRLGDLDLAQDHLLGVIGHQSVTLQQLDGIETRLQDLKLTAQESLNVNEATDYTSAILQMQEEQNLLQFTFSSLANLASTSILDFLR